MTTTTWENKALKILLIEDNSTDANWLKTALSNCGCQNHFTQVTKAEKAVVLFQHENFDAILLDLSFSDRHNLNELNILRQQVPQLPIIVLTSTDDPKLVALSIHQGARDCLVKGKLTGVTLIQTVQRAIERQHDEFRLSQKASMKGMLERICNFMDLEAILKTTAREIQQFLQSDRAFFYRCPLGQTDARGIQPLDEKFVRAIDFSALPEPTSFEAVADTRSMHSSKVGLSALVRSYLILPIWSEESLDIEDNLSLITADRSDYRPQQSLWGILVAYNFDRVQEWHDWEIDFLQQLTAKVTTAIGQSRLCCQLQIANQKLQKLAILDGLTGIANRRYFDLVIDQEWQRLTRGQQPLSLILCDIDYFKAYNDTYGHQQGDRCLQQVAQILRQSIKRPADLAARYGGEELALILPNTDYRGAWCVAQRVLRQLAREQIPHPKSPVSQFVTLSLGVATKIPERSHSFRNLIDVADKYLYQAKQAGRNRLVNDEISNLLVSYY